MKYLLCITFTLAAFFITKKQPDQPCQIQQQYYLKGELVHAQAFPKSIIEHGCGASKYIVMGKDIWADSVVTSLK